MKASRVIAVAASLLTVSFASIGAPLLQTDPGSTGEARPEARAATASQEPRQICRREKQTGSNRSTRVCRSAEEMERERQNAERQLTPQSLPQSRRE